MKPCPTCGGSGEVPSPGWAWVQLYEFGAWHNYLDFATVEEAVKRAQATNWGEHARVKHRGQIVWAGVECAVAHAEKDGL